MIGHAFTGEFNATGQTQTVPLLWSSSSGLGYDLLDTGSAQTHTLYAEVGDNCSSGGHFTATAVMVDVLYGQ